MNNENEEFAILELLNDNNFTLSFTNLIKVEDNKIINNYYISIMMGFYTIQLYAYSIIVLKYNYKTLKNNCIVTYDKNRMVKNEFEILFNKIMEIIENKMEHSLEELFNGKVNYFQNV